MHEEPERQLSRPANGRRDVPRIIESCVTLSHSGSLDERGGHVEGEACTTQGRYGHVVVSGTLSGRAVGEDGDGDDDDDDGPNGLPCDGW